MFTDALALPSCYGGGDGAQVPGAADWAAGLSPNKQASGLPRASPSALRNNPDPLQKAEGLGSHRVT